MTVHVASTTRQGARWDFLETTRQGAWWDFLELGGPTLCGKKVPSRTARAKIPSEKYLATIPLEETIGLRLVQGRVPGIVPTRPLFLPSSDRRRKPCKECFRIAGLTDAERVVELAAQEARKKEALDKLRQKKALESEAKLQALQAEVDSARVDANACYDAWLSEPRVVFARCGVAMSHGGSVECNLPNYHVGNHRSDVDPALDLNEVLDRALQAFKLANPRSRGDRLWIFGVDPARGTKDHPDGHMRDRDVICRFCNRCLGRDMRLGVDYSEWTFYPPGSRLPDMGKGPWAMSNYGSLEYPAQVVNVREHTVTCALQYLLGLKPQ